LSMLHFAVVQLSVILWMSGVCCYWVGCLVVVLLQFGVNKGFVM